MVAGAGFKTFGVGDVLTASDVNTYLMQQAVMNFADSGARGSAIGTAVLSEGMVSYLQDTNAVEVYDGSAWTELGGGVSQVVVASDASDRTTTSTSYVDASISVTITPKDAANRLVLFWAANVKTDYINALRNIDLAITTSGNTALQGAESARVTWDGSGAFGSVGSHVTIIGNVIAGSTSAQTFKGRFKANAGTASILNATNTGMLIACEVKP